VCERENEVIRSKLLGPARARARVACKCQKDIQKNSTTVFTTKDITMADPPPTDNNTTSKDDSSASKSYLRDWYDYLFSTTNKRRKLDPTTTAVATTTATTSTSSFAANDIKINANTNVNANGNGNVNGNANGSNHSTIGTKFDDTKLNAVGFAVDLKRGAVRNTMTPHRRTLPRPLSSKKNTPYRPISSSSRAYVSPYRASSVYKNSSSSSLLRSKQKAPSRLWNSAKKLPMNAGKDESGGSEPLFSKKLIQELTSQRERNKGRVVAASTEREVVGRRPVAPQQMGKQEFGMLSSSSSMRTPPTSNKKPYTPAKTSPAPSLFVDVTPANVNKNVKSQITSPSGASLGSVSKTPVVIEDMSIVQGMLPSIGDTKLIGLPMHIRDFVGAEEERDTFLDEQTRDFIEVEDPFEIIIKLDPLLNASNKPKGLPFSFMPEATNKSTNDKRKLSPVKNSKAPSREKVEKKISPVMPPPPVPTSGQGWGNIFADVKKGKWKCNVSFLFVRRNLYPLLNLSLYSTVIS